MLASIEEIDAVNRERQSNPNRFRDGYSINDWNTKIFPARKELIRSKADNKSQKIRATIIEKQKELTHVRSYHLSNLINGDNEAVVFGYNKSEMLREKKRISL